MKAYKTMPRHQQSDLFGAWRAFAAAANSVDAALLSTETFPYDLVDITRQVRRYFFLSMLVPSSVCFQAVFKLRNKRKTKQRMVPMRDPNPVPQNPCRN